MAAEHLETIRSVHQAAQQLTLVCTEFVGPVSMAVSLTATRTLAEPLPRRLQRDVEEIEKREGRA